MKYPNKIRLNAPFLQYQVNSSAKVLRQLTLLYINECFLLQSSLETCPSHYNNNRFDKQVLGNRYSLD